MILDATGHSMVYVNGQPHVGDIYQHGYVRLPVSLQAGQNEFLFHGSRGALRAKLISPRSRAQFDLADATLPDLLVGEPVAFDGAVVVLQNGGTGADQSEPQLFIEATIPGSAPCRTALPAFQSTSARKHGFRIVANKPQAPGDCELDLKLVARAGDVEQILDSASVKLRIVQPWSTHKRTFRSAIDGSVQYFAVIPDKDLEKGSRATEGDRGAATEQRSRSNGLASPALVFTLHGASVEASGQAAAYSAKSGVVTVAPTNRRPYGFDWEDWGRLDAIEVLELVQEQFKTDQRRTYLTGHSMGGHGTWHIGATFPDRFAAIGPSAGWISMFSYAGARRASQNQQGVTARISELFDRCMSPSDTLALVRNYMHHGVYVLHGEMDEQVPVDQARTMKGQLQARHQDYEYYEEPGAGHWWGKDLAEFTKDGATWGTACVDWPPMLHFFARHTTPQRGDVRHVEFATASPGISARSHWVTIAAQAVPLRMSAVEIDHDPMARRFVGTTENVAWLCLDVSHLSSNEPVQIKLDNQLLSDVPYPAKGSIWVNRTSDRWSVSTPPPASHKGPSRYGTFKDVFRNRFLLVFGTQGTEAENLWSLAKAQYDAEQFWYRGNGSVDLVADAAFCKEGIGRGTAFTDRNVILYGNKDTNSAWSELLPHGSVQVTRGKVSVGNRELSGDDLAVLFIAPRPDSDIASVGVVAGTGLIGMRLTERVPYFVSGVALPDLTILGSEMLTNGINGVRAAGFFGLDWRPESGEIIWTDRGD
jgi:dienelactone hydrolase